MPQCVAWGCTNKSGITQGKTFHRFPKDPKRRACWITALRREGFQPGDNTRLCGDHFEDDCFILSGKPRLKEDAVPTVFDFPNHLKKKITPRKPPNNRDQGESSSADEEAAPEEAAYPVVPDNLSVEHSYCSSPHNLKRRLDDTLEKFEENRKKLRAAKARNQRLQKKVTSLASVIENLKDKNLVSDSCVALLETTFTGVPLHLMKRMMMSKSGVKSAGFHPALKAFVLTLQFYSTKAYNYVRETFDLGLPHVSFVRRWYSSVDGKPGFSSEILDTLKKKADEATAAGKEVLCSLMMDEMAIRRFVEWDGEKMVGFVDIGTNIVDNVTTPYATEALVFMLVAVNSSWKVPVGYFLTHELSGSEKANVVKQCLLKVHETGVKVISLTCDGPPSHFSMLKELGACMDPQNLDPSFQHPAGNGERVFVLLDVCHMLKLVQNVFSMCRLLRDKDGNVIRWKFLEDLHDIQERGLYSANKLNSAHLQWQSQKMKVKLAAQTLSSSVADALEFCRDGLQLEEFRNCEGTVNFIRLIDTLFDVLHSRNRFSKGMKTAMKPETEEQTISFLDDAYNYIASIQDIAGNHMVATAKRTPFIGFMAAIQSVKALYKLYVGEGKPLQYLLTYKLSQDHLELFFCAIRAAGGFSNNPTSKQFVAAFKRLMMRHGVSVVTGNAVPQDHTSVLTSVSVTSAMKRSISDPSEDIMVARRYDLDQPEHHQGETLPEIPDLPELSIYKEAAVGYIAGFVVKMMAKRTLCPECQSALTTKALHGSQTSHWLTIQKDRGCLQKPSESVVNICQVSERLLQKVMLKTGQMIPQGTSIPGAIGYAVLKEVGGRVFQSLDGHMLDTEPDNNHIFPLIKTVTHVYLKIRMHHIAKQHNMHITGKSICKTVTKLFLFKH